MVKATLELCKFDTPDADGDLMTRETAQQMIDDWKLSPAPTPVRRDYQGGVLGRVERMWIAGNSVMVELSLNIEGRLLVRDKKFQAALGGQCERIPCEHGAFAAELKSIKLTDVALTDKKIAYG